MQNKVKTAFVYLIFVPWGLYLQAVICSNPRETRKSMLVPLKMLSLCLLKTQHVLGSLRRLSFPWYRSTSQSLYLLFNLPGTKHGSEKTLLGQFWKRIFSSVVLLWFLFLKSSKGEKVNERWKNNVFKSLIVLNSTLD